MQALPRQTPPHRDADGTSAASPMDANHAAIALATAMNDARAALSVREEAAADAREASLQRLQALRAKLAPLYAAIPRDVELFDLGFVTPEKPRLFVDIIAYVEPARSGSGYRFVQESRAGRTTLVETEDEAALIGEITRYVAHRLVSRERALAQAEDYRPGPLIRQPAPTAPLTAEEAFRQWTRGGQSREPQPETATTWMQKARVAAPEEEPARQTVPLQDNAALREAVDREPRAAGEEKREAAPPSRVRQWPEATVKPVRQGQGWWLWPTMALLIGCGLGALGIYFYTAGLL